MSTCNKNHRSAPTLTTLDTDQSDPNGRHKCAGCAIIAGFSDGLEGIDSRFDTIKDTLPESQAKAGRHKNARQAYERGYALGQNERNNI